MKIELKERQKAIVNSLRLKGSEENKTILGELENEQLVMADIEKLCNLINEEFMTEGILPGFEPNAYGREREALLDIINGARIRE